MSNTNELKLVKGQKFGRLTVNKFSHVEGGKHIYLCDCDCGTVNKHVPATRLNKGVITRCGTGCKLDAGLSIFNIIYRDLKRRGRNPDRCQFFLTKERTFELMKGNCNYCKRPPTTTRTVERLNGKHFTYNGIDRVDSTKPYEEGNVVSCCSVCNFMKHILTVDEFKEHITLLYDKFVLKQ